jgi:hypothetical protein
LLGRGLRAIERSRPSLGYEPYFVRRGDRPIIARFKAALTRYLGTQTENKGKPYCSVIEAIRFLAKARRRRRSAISRRIYVVLTAYEETSVVDVIFADCPVSKVEFVECLRCAARGDDDSLQRAMKIATMIAPNLAISRGPKVGLASATHGNFLQVSGAYGTPRGYKWNPAIEDFDDPQIVATRLEFSIPGFDPRPARWKIKPKRKRSSGSRN